MTVGWLLAQVLAVRAAHQLGQFLVDDLDDLLGGGQAFHDLLPMARSETCATEVLGDFVVDVRFQQRHADFAHGSLDVRLGQFALAAQFFEYAIQAIVKDSNAIWQFLLRVKTLYDLQHFVGIVRERAVPVRTALVLQHADLHDQLVQPGEVFLHLCVAAGVAQLCASSSSGGFAMLDGVPHTLRVMPKFSAISARERSSS